MDSDITSFSSSCGCCWVSCCPGAIKSAGEGFTSDNTSGAKPGGGGGGLLVVSWLSFKSKDSFLDDDDDDDESVAAVSKGDTLEPDEPCRFFRSPEPFFLLPLLDPPPSEFNSFSLVLADKDAEGFDDGIPAICRSLDPSDCFANGLPATSNVAFAAVEGASYVGLGFAVAAVDEDDDDDDARADQVAAFLSFPSFRCTDSTLSWYLSRCMLLTEFIRDS